MSYRTKPEIYGNLHRVEAKPGQRLTIIGACLGLMIPGLGRTLSKTGWFGDPDLLISGSLIAGFICIFGGIVAGIMARRKVGAKIEDTVHG